MMIMNSGSKRKKKQKTRKHKGDGYTSGNPGTMTQKTGDKWKNRNHQKQWYLLFFVPGPNSFSISITWTTI